MKEILFTLAFFFTSGNVIDTNFKLHKYDKENFKKIYYSKNKELVTTFCVKHSELEDVKKSKYNHHNDGQKTKYQGLKTQEKMKVEGAEIKNLDK